MKKISLLLITALTFGVVSCDSETDANTENEKTTMEEKMKDNPLVQQSGLSYQAPDFSKIKDEHFGPAMAAGVANQKENIQKIVEQEEEPTFENTIIALDQSGNLLRQVANVFFALTSANTNDVLTDLQEEYAPKLSALNDEIYLNDTLFKRVQTLHDKIEELDLDPESEKLLENYYTDFVIAGAKLGEDEKEQLKEINGKIASLTTKFGNLLVDAAKEKAYVVENKEDLAGLSDSYLKSIQTEDGKYRIPLDNTTQQDVLSSLENREMRKNIFKNAWLRNDGGDFDTKEIITEIAQLRLKKANLLGFDNYASWSLQKTMAKTTDDVNNFFNELIPASLKKAEEEAHEIEKMMHDQGQEGELEPWDWNYYGEMVRKAKYNFNEDEIKPYFEMDSVLINGVFYAATQLYGITFEERTDIPVYHEDVKVYELFEEDGSELGLFYADFYKRDNKRGGAWMSNFVEQSKLEGTKPVIYNVCNFNKPSEGEPALLSFDNVITMFHEFGHALHGFFADQEYVSLSGTNVARDFVEFPSQINEKWATYPDVLHNYAKHYETGEVIPDELVEKFKKAASFNQGYGLTELLGAATLDFAWHSIDEGTTVDDANEFEKEALHSYGLDKIAPIKTRYRSTYFSHIFSGGYAAGYYSYLWTEMLDFDGYQWFVENGGMTRDNGQRYRDMVLSRGNTQDLDEMYREWREQEPSLEPMIEGRGMN